MRDYLSGIGQLLLGIAAMIAVFKIPEYRLIVELREQLKSVNNENIFLKQKVNELNFKCDTRIQHENSVLDNKN